MRSTNECMDLEPVIFCFIEVYWHVIRTQVGSLWTSFRRHLSILERHQLLIDITAEADGIVSRPQRKEEKEMQGIGCSSRIYFLQSRIGVLVILNCP